MDIASMKLDLMQQLMSIMDEATLKRLANYFKKELPVSDDGITEEQLAELDVLRAERLRGEGSSHTWEEVQRKARDAVRG